MVNIFCKLISLSLRNILFWDRLWIKISLWHYVKCYINESCHNPSFYSELRLDRHTEIAGWLITNGSQERLGACLKVNKILHLILISLGWQSQSQFLTDKNRIKGCMTGGKIDLCRQPNQLACSNWWVPTMEKALKLRQWWMKFLSPLTEERAGRLQKEKNNLTLWCLTDLSTGIINATVLISVPKCVYFLFSLY